MRKRLVLTGFLTGGFLSLVFAGAADESKRNPTETEIVKLKSEIASLTLKVAELEKKFHQLEASPGMVPDHNWMPNGWQQREFNGQPFYVVPLSDSPK